MATVVNIPSITQVRKSFHFFINVAFLFLLAFFLTILIFHPNSRGVLQAPKRSHPITNYFSTPTLNNVAAAASNCSEIKQHHDFKAKCEFLKSNKGCGSSGYIDYLQLFYCIFGSAPITGYIILIIWLVVLFYLLGSTADDYFVPSLKSLSDVLRLTPTMAGVTFLSFGNGAPDVFSSIVSFMGTTNGSGAVGLNSVLGAGFFVSSVVVGVISVSISSRGVCVDKKSFVRDILFYFLTLSAVLVIVTVGAISIWGAMAFVCLYLIYVLLVYTMDSNAHDESKAGDSLEESSAPLLGDSSDGKTLVSIENGGKYNGMNTVWGRFARVIELGFLYGIDKPLSLPRRMTIPLVSDDENWSKPYAVVSVALAPVLLVALTWGSQKETVVPYLMGGLAGIVFGSLAIFTTNKSNPPKTRKILLVWLLGGFLMSVTWVYLVAGELVSLLVTLGKLFGISPLILGLTVLAWGNSLGDFISNSALAKKGGVDGAQTAISGCYAGPIFNAIMGLGLGLLISAWSQYPAPFPIPRDTTLYETVGFLMAGLLWALVMTLRNNMKLGKVMGCGLLGIYLCFISLRLIQVLLF